MKTFRKVGRLLLYAVAGLLVAAAGGLAYLKFALPNVGPPPDLNVEATAVRLQRGEHLAKYEMGCLDCHSPHDKTAFLHPRNGPVGSGQTEFIPGLPAPNLTPTGIGTWTDGELYRAITTGVSKDGRALHPIMPYDHYGLSDLEDIYAVIAYLRTLPAAGQKYAPPSFDVPFNFVVNTLPAKRTPGKRPNPADTLAYGEYLVQNAACVHCHMQQDERGTPIAGTEFTGGMAFPQPNGTVCYSANLTPCWETGLGGWTRQQFIARFRTFTDYQSHVKTVAQGEFNSEMPWLTYSHLSDGDLSAIYAYLQTLTPVRHKVTKYQQAPLAMK